MSHREGAPLKAFAAVAEVLNDSIYQVELSEDFKLFRIAALNTGIPCSFVKS